MSPLSAGRLILGTWCFIWSYACERDRARWYLNFYVYRQNDVVVLQNMAVKQKNDRPSITQQRCIRFQSWMWRFHNTINFRALASPSVVVVTQKRIKIFSWYSLEIKFFIILKQNRKLESFVWKFKNYFIEQAAYVYSFYDHKTCTNSKLRLCASSHPPGFEHTHQIPESDNFFSFRIMKFISNIDKFEGAERYQW